MLCSFLVSPPENLYPILPSPASMKVLTHPLPFSRHSPTLGHLTPSGPRASPFTDVQQGHPLLHMQLEPWVTLCVLFGWWFSPRELCRYWLVHIVVLLMGLQTPSAPWVLPLAFPLGTLCSVQWMAVVIHFCICQALAEPPRRQLYHATVRKHMLASTIMSGLGIIYGMNTQVWQYLDDLYFRLCSTLYLHIFSCEYFVLLVRRTEASILWSSFLMSFMGSMNCILVIWSFCANIHLLVSSNHVCSFLVRWPQLGWLVVSM